MCRLPEARGRATLTGTRPQWAAAWRAVESDARATCEVRRFRNVLNHLVNTHRTHHTHRYRYR